MTVPDVRIEFLTPPSSIEGAASATSDRKVVLTPESFRKFLLSEHSPIRSVVLRITMEDLSYYTSVHFVRHVHTQHYVRSNRPDRSKKERSVDDQVVHVMDVNCEALIAMARKRLCSCAAPDTRATMKAIVEAMRSSGDEYMRIIADFLVPSCVYRAGCPEPWGNCGFYERLSTSGRDINMRYQDYAVFGDRYEKALV